MHWSSGGREAEAQFGSRRFALEADERSTLCVAGPDRPARKVLVGPHRKLGELQFSPSGDRLAFLVGTTVAVRIAGGTLDASGGWTELYVVDLDGNVVLGDRKALEGEPEVVRRRIHRYHRYRWDPRGTALIVQESTFTPRGEWPAYRERRIGVPRAAPPPR